MSSKQYQVLDTHCRLVGVDTRSAGHSSSETTNTQTQNCLTLMRAMHGMPPVYTPMLTANPQRLSHSERTLLAAVPTKPSWLLAEDFSHATLISSATD